MTVIQSCGWVVKKKDVGGCVFRGGGGGRGREFRGFVRGSRMELRCRTAAETSRGNCSNDKFLRPAVRLRLVATCKAQARNPLGAGISRGKEGVCHRIRKSEGTLVRAQLDVAV